MRLSILIFDGLTTLDAIGGYEVLSRIPGMEVEFVAREKGVIAADTRRLGLLAFRSFDEVQTTDIVYVPGGPGSRPLETDEAFLDYLRMLDRSSTWTVGICSGVSLLAAAGLLEGMQATTNWFDRHRIAAHGVEFIAERFHRHGKYVTVAGVLASIDTGLFLTQLIAGDAVAMAIQLGIEYYPAPPFPQRTPAEAPDAIQQVVARFEASGGVELLRQRPVFEDLIRG